MPDPQIISRRDAADQGKLFFFTGKPCKHGHVSPRYVTSGGCKSCLTGMFKPRRNAWTGLLVPFSNSHLWTYKEFTREQRVALRVYLQRCIFEFIRTQLKATPLNVQAEVEAAMLEIEERLQWVSAEDPRNTD